MKLTKVLLIISIGLSVAWAITSNFEYEPLIVTLGLLLNLITLSIEYERQLNKLKLEGDPNTKIKEINQENEGGQEQENNLTFKGQIESINQTNKKNEIYFI